MKVPPDVTLGWTDDNYGTYTPDAIDPHCRQEETRVVRGGSWGDSADHLRAANRLFAQGGILTRDALMTLEASDIAASRVFAEPA